MSESTKIEWCDASWNPIRGCSMAKGSETGGCLNCYAARMCARGLPGLNSPTTGEPFAVMRDSGPRWTGKVELIESALELPLHWRKPRRIFVNSMSDLFHESLPNEAIDRVFAVMALCPQHTFQVLTKRPERMVAYLTGGPWGHIEQRASETIGTRREIPVEHLPLAHVHFGISCENQETADARIPLLLQTPAAVRFLSLEPLLSPVDLSKWLYDNTRSRVPGTDSIGLVQGYDEWRDPPHGEIRGRGNDAEPAPNFGNSGRAKLLSRGRLSQGDVYGIGWKDEGVGSPNCLDGVEPFGHLGSDGDQPQERKQAGQPPRESGTGYQGRERHPFFQGTSPEEESSARSGQPYGEDDAIAGGRDPGALESQGDESERDRGSLRHNTVSGIGDSSSEILVGIHQVIVGGESGPGARPMHPDWVRSIRDQCVAAGVPFFFKQAIIGGKKVSMPELDASRHAEIPRS
jgi:protein gp37